MEEEEPVTEEEEPVTEESSDIADEAVTEGIPDLPSSPGVQSTYDTYYDTPMYYVL